MARTIADVMAAARGVIDSLAPHECAEEMAAGAVLIDTRCEDDRRAEGEIGGAIAHARSVLEWRADPTSPDRDDRIADLDKRLIVMCNDGFSSVLAAAALAELGFKRPGHMEGGFRAWSASGLPVEPFA